MLPFFLNRISSNPGIFLLFRKIIHFGFRAEGKVIRKFVTTLLPRSKVLQIACESGYFSVFFKEFYYFGIDTRKKNIAYAHQHFEGNFLVMDAMSIEFPPGSFDAIIISGVFHNIDDITTLQVFREAKRVLKNRGRVLILEDYFETGPLNLIDRIDRYFDPPEVIRTYTQYLEIFNHHFCMQYDGTIFSGPRKIMVFQTSV